MGFWRWEKNSKNRIIVGAIMMCIFAFFTAWSILMVAGVVQGDGIGLGFARTSATAGVIVNGITTTILASLTIYFYIRRKKSLSKGND